MATSEIDGAHGLPRGIASLTNELQQVIHDAGKQSISNDVQPKYAQRYFHRFIQCVNREKEEIEGYKRKTRTGMIEVLGLIHKREKLRDTRLAWFMFQIIYHMHHDIKNK